MIRDNVAFFQTELYGQPYTRVFLNIPLKEKYSLLKSEFFPLWLPWQPNKTSDHDLNCIIRCTDTSRLREKSRIFQAKSEIGSCKKREKSENISKPYTLPVLVSLTEVVGLNVDQIGLTSFDPDSDLVIFEAKSALVYSVTVFYLSNCWHILCVATLEGEIQGRFLTKDR